MKMRLAFLHMRKTLAVVSPLVFFVSLFWAAAQSQSYTYIRIGQKSDAKTIPAFGIAMMGGGAGSG